MGKGGLRPVRQIKHLKPLQHVAEMRKNPKDSGAIRKPPPMQKNETVHSMCTVLISANCIDGLGLNPKKGNSKKFGAIHYEPPQLGKGR